MPTDGQAERVVIRERAGRHEHGRTQPRHAKDAKRSRRRTQRASRKANRSR